MEKGRKIRDRGSILRTFIICILLVVLGALICYIYMNYTKQDKVQNVVKATMKYNSDIEDKVAIELEKARQTVEKIQEYMDEFKLRVEVTTAYIDFPFNAIDKTNFWGANTVQYYYYFDYDIGCELENLNIFYDGVRKKVVILLPKEKFKVYRLRENIARTEVIKREVTGSHKEFEGKLGFGTITDAESNANEKAALFRAEEQVRQKREAWFEGENNEFEGAYQALISQMEKFLQSKEDLQTNIEIE